MSEEIQAIQTVLEEMEMEMMEAIDSCDRELKGVRTGRASSGLVEGVLVDCYGAKMPIKQVATITVPEPRLIVIQPWDKNNVAAVEKGIHHADLGLTPVSDGHVVRIPIPALTEERRKDLVKLVRRAVEEGRVSVRNARRSANERIRDLEKKSSISEDDRFRSEKKIQEITDQHVAKMDGLLANKEKELTEV